MQGVGRNLARLPAGDRALWNLQLGGQLRLGDTNHAAKLFDLTMIEGHYSTFAIRYSKDDIESEVDVKGGAFRDSQIIGCSSASVPLLRSGVATQIDHSNGIGTLIFRK
jgi:hypothetical protein